MVGEEPVCERIDNNLGSGNNRNYFAAFQRIDLFFPTQHLPKLPVGITRSDFSLLIYLDF